MIKKLLVTTMFVALAGCGGDNPFEEEEVVEPGTEEPVEATVREGLGPGTTDPSPSSSIVRREEVTEDGNGFAQAFAFNAETDTFTVDNIAFDGDTEGQSDYIRGQAVSELGPFAVYEATTPALDLLDNSPINQLFYRALFGVSDSGNTQFAIVRTGSFIPFGFGGFVYQREGGVVLPTTGQADYEGTYAGIRDFEGAPGLEFVEGDARIAIDFEDFNEGDSMRAAITNRRVFDIAGTDITADIVDALDAENDDIDVEALPVLQFAIGPNAGDENGEFIGEAFSTLGNTTIEEGNFFAVVSGDDAEEVVGIIVVTSDDPRFDEDITVRETGGFIVYRDNLEP